MHEINTLNPSFSSTYFNDEQCEAYIRSHLGAEMAYYFKHESHGAYKADIFRLVLLYFEGGYYLDVDLDMKLP
eukprot:CAMPEP_0197047100 /NCGR_PEP_ID=MMETSP1384-20130603/22655_1 /TAXON_ID=29189 /ORGANISM="Ammonia sp." /LENGTH=72 /DNA_ID=CAMNT_0042478973 /DNA_START=64 /DNA_END=278 /DNA_ORIENTATION=+